MWKWKCGSYLFVVFIVHISLALLRCYVCICSVGVFESASAGVFESANLIAFIFCRLLVRGEGEALAVGYNN